MIVLALKMAFLRLFFGLKITFLGLFFASKMP